MEQSTGSGSFEQDPWVDRMRPDPSSAPHSALILEGLAGRSDREGYCRLYFNTDLNYYAEFANEDILFSEPIPQDQAPFPGHKATRVAILQDAIVEYTRSTTANAQDPFAMDIQVSMQGQEAPGLLPRRTLGGETCLRTDCFGRTCDTCIRTCDTCNTQCGQATCNTCNTCQTNCGQATCNTCNTCQTNCQQATCVTCDTCHTCLTDCRGRTCVTCHTCNPRVQTCGMRPPHCLPE